MKRLTRVRAHSRLAAVLAVLRSRRQRGLRGPGRIDAEPCRVFAVRVPSIGPTPSQARRHPRSRWTSPLVATAASLSILATGCSGNSNADPESGSSPSSPAVSSSTAAPSPTPSSWESEFSDEQLAKFERALGRWTDYERESEPMWAYPKPTADTLSFFAEYFYNEDVMQGRLTQYADAEVRIDGVPDIVWSKPVRVRGASVRIRQCVDPASVRVTQHNQVVPNSAGPILREIDLSVPKGAEDYLIQQIHDLSWGRKEQRCAA